MLLIGLLLLAAAGAFTGLVIAENRSGGPDYTVTMFDNTLGTVNTLGAFLAGIGMTLVFFIALALIFGGLARRRRRAATPRHAASHGPAEPTHKARTEPLADDVRPGMWERATGPKGDGSEPTGAETRHGRLRQRLQP
ncbi:hypothetical protein [Streptomyces sp. NBC_01353]|uniref:hypothetical protein n=1 Tax=Streptomyces sp. NBC_01353 TaxID=2903835 RepID=UPI002E372229|nr:hypothetical protein [Streptomyces sp. NBC_01353]